VECEHLARYRQERARCKAYGIAPLTALLMSRTLSEKSLTVDRGERMGDRLRLTGIKRTSMDGYHLLDAL
jgi:hypothetical protein